MAEKFRKIVNTPHQAFGRAREKIREMTPTSKSGKVARVAGMGMSGLFQFLLWATKYVALDNHALRALENLLADMRVSKSTNGRDKKISAFMKQYPNFSAHVMYYLMATMTVAGGVAYEKADGMSDATDSELLDTNNEPENPRMNYDGAVDLSLPINEMVEYFWPDMALALTELETYRDTPARHLGESRYTRGPGLTWHYTRDGAGRLHQYANDKNTPVIGRDGNYEQGQMHLEFETFRKIRANASDKQNITNRHVIGIALAGYQRPGDIVGIIGKIDAAQTKQEVADAFLHFYGMSKKSKYFTGSLKRRWFCAALACGVITVDDFLDMQRDAFSAVEVNSIYRNGHFKLDAATVQYALSRVKKENPNNTCCEFLNEFKTGRDILKRLNHGGQTKTIDFSLEAASTASENQSIRLLTQADTQYRAKNYSAAAQLYAQAIDSDPDNMEAYSSLALAYKKLGDEKNSVEYYQKCCDAVKRGNARMNANKTLLYDADVKAATYYNAGLAREAMADLYAARGDRQNAARNYDLAAKNYKTAISNVERGDNNPARINAYSRAMARANKKKAAQKKDKKIAFGGAVKNMRDKNARRDVLIYGTQYDGNMA